MLHSHINSVRFQRSIAEITTVVLLHTVIVLSDDIRFCRSVIVLHQGALILKHTQSDVCRHA